LGNTGQPPIVKKEKNALAAALFSVLFTGSGQVYNGQTMKGIGILIAAIIGYFLFVIPGLIVIIYGIYDAYTTAQKMNKGELPFIDVSVGKVIMFIVAEIIIFVIVFTILAAIIYTFTGTPDYYY
jgi:TM2 domain-containing membrane protein YozV